MGRTAGLRAFLLTTLLPVAFTLGACTDDPSTVSLPGQVTDVEYAMAHGELVLSWTAVEGADGYFVELLAPTSELRTATLSADETTITFGALAPGDYAVTVYAMSAEGMRGLGKRFGVHVPTESELVDSITALLPTSLHGTAKGMEYWYAHPDGYAGQVGVSYAELNTCSTCHVYNTALTGAPADQPCLACHAVRTDDPTKPDYTVVEDAKCMKCHGRQSAEIAMGYTDVHRTAGMKCGDCHSGAEVHGSYSSTMFDVLATRCETCHRRGPGGPPATAATHGTQMPRDWSHTGHNQTLSCQACHQGGTVTCYNCHLEDELVKSQRVAYRRIADWTFLGNYRGKVYPLNFTSLQYQGETHNAWGPFHGHTVSTPGRECSDCHGTANVLAVYQGTLAVTKWDPVTGTLKHVPGVIPVPADYMSRLMFDYLNKETDGTWSFVEQGPDRSQMLYASPLTATQMQALSQPR